MKPVPPRIKLVSRDKSVEVLWDDLAEQSPDPGTQRQDFLGYRLYRAAGWKRNPDTGTTGPREELWELLGDWSLRGSAYGSAWRSRYMLVSGSYSSHPYRGTCPTCPR